ncbi:NTPase, partial [Xanthomonas citri pv. citri]|nr:NTPase [Xanthomonas citri pv. citri]
DQQAVINYVNDNIDIFVEKVLLTEEIEEPEESFLELLNREDLDKRVKHAMIMKKTFAISDIGELIKELWPIVIRENKMVACWSNVITSYVEYNKKMPDFLIAF